MASVVVTMDAREAALYRAQEKILKKQIELNNKMKEGGRTSERAGQQSKQSFDKSSTALGKLKTATVSYIAGVASVAAAVQTVKAAWEAVKKEQEDGLTALQKTETANRRLLQVSDTQQQFESRMARADAIAAREGIDRATVRTAQFDAISSGIEPEFEKLAAANSVIALESSVKAGGQIPQLFAKEALSAIESVSAVLRASQSSLADAETITKVLPTAAAGAAQLGASFDETTASVAAFTNVVKNAEKASDLINAFASKAALDERFSGQGLVETAREIQALPEADRKKFLGESIEMNSAQTYLLQLGESIDTLAGELKRDREAAAAGTGGALLGKQSMALQNVQIQALKSEAAARQALEVAQADRLGVSGANANTAQVRAQGMLLESGSWLGRLANNIFGVGNFASRAASSLGVGEDASTRIGFLAAEGAGATSPTAAMEFLAKVAVQLKIASTNLDQAAAKINAGSGSIRAQAASGGGL